MKIIKWILAYILYFIACMFVVVIALQGLSDGLQMLFAFVTPVLIIWWRERQKAAKNLSTQDRAEGQDYLPSNETSPESDTLGYSRTQELRQKLFGEDASPFTPPMPAQPYGARPASAVRPPETSRVSQRKSQNGWVPKGQTVVVAGRLIDGMVYVGTPPQTGSYSYGEKCRAYIDPSANVAKVGSDRRGDGLSYWPGYSSIPAVCRATYLDWLAEGRVDGSVNPGYLFLFFYGLERRFLLDQPSDEEKRQIIAEVERLKVLFEHNYSVQRYLGEFVDLARIAAMGKMSLDDPALKASILANRSWELPFSLKFALGGIVANGSPIDAEWLQLWLACHPERRMRTPADRCADEFAALFRLKFDKLYPVGLTVRKPKKLLTMNYRAASSEFSCTVSPATGDGGDVPIPDISEVRSPVQVAQKIADETMDELDKFSRYLGRNPDGRGSIEAQALLPSELWRVFPSAELEKLKAWANAKIAAGGLVPVKEVVTRLEGATTANVGKRQLTGAADALARLGFGLAPDPRYSLRGPKADEPVVLIEIGKQVEKLEEVSEAYRQMLLEIAIATFIAHADQQIVEAERRALSEKIEQADGIAEVERHLLHANLAWYLAVPPDMSLLRAKLKIADAEHHMALRAAVVAIAHADSVIQSEEVAGIEKIYKALGLDPALVYSDLHAGEIPNAPLRVKSAEPDAPGEKIPAEVPPKSAALDLSRIAAIRSDTQRVSAVLGQIFAAESGDSDAAVAVIPSILGGLDGKHAQLVEELVIREHWTEQEFKKLVTSHGLLVSGALETINEWAFSKFEEALLDEYEGYDVAPDIAEALKSEFVKENQ